jgi:hypothetical protein
MERQNKLPNIKPKPKIDTPIILPKVLKKPTISGKKEDPIEDPWLPIALVEKKKIFFPGKNTMGNDSKIPIIKEDRYHDGICDIAFDFNIKKFKPTENQSMEHVDFSTLKKLQETNGLKNYFLPLPEFEGVVTIVELEDNFLEIYEGNQNFYLQFIDAWNIGKSKIPTKEHMYVVKEGLEELEHWFSKIDVFGDYKSTIMVLNEKPISNFCDKDCLDFLQAID